MRYKSLPRTFFLQDTHDVAKGLLGKLLVRRWRNKDIIARVCEVESYVGENDQACHAAKGLTKRTAVMFGEAGYAYVYMIYGMYHCLNVVTERTDFPAAVLIRGAIPVTGFDSCFVKGGASRRQRRLLAPPTGEPRCCGSRRQRTSTCRSGLAAAGTSTGRLGLATATKSLLAGPGKLTREMKITRSLNSEYLVKSKRLFLAEDGFIVGKDNIVSAPRIGVDYAGEDAKLPWRYYLNNCGFISRK